MTPLHRGLLRVTEGGAATIPLEPQTTAAFYRSAMSTLRRLGVPVAIHTTPNELPQPMPFDVDEIHRSYDAGFVNRAWRVLVQVERVFEESRARFVGKCRPNGVLPNAWLSIRDPLTTTSAMQRSGQSAAMMPAARAPVTTGGDRLVDLQSIH